MVCCVQSNHKRGDEMALNLIYSNSVPDKLQLKKKAVVWYGAKDILGDTISYV